MTKLSDLQCILISTAAARDDGSLYPLPSPAAHPAATAKAISALLRRAYVEERETSDAAHARQTDGDLQYGLYAMPAGLAAIGVDDDQERIEPSTSAPSPAPVSPAKRQTKGGMLLSMLQRDDGATLPDLISATGWLPHTVRAALTGLRKKGHAIERGKRDGVTCYAIKVAG